MANPVSTKKSSKEKIRSLVAVAVFIALAYICCVLFHFRVSFLSFDLKDAIMAIGAMFFGPLYGLAMVIIVSLIELLTISGTGVYGLIMNICSSAPFVCVGSLIYSYKRNMKGAAVGMVMSVVSMVVVMMVANLVVTSNYMHVTVGEIAALIPTLLLPFNLTKAVFNASIVFLLYKPMSTALKAAGFLKTDDAAGKGYKPNPLALILPIVAAVACLLFFFFYLNGSFEFGQ